MRALFAVALPSALAAVGDLTVGPAVPTSADSSSSTSIANFDDYASIMCVAASPGIECSLLIREGMTPSGAPWIYGAGDHGSLPSHSDTADGMTTLKAPTSPAAKVMVTTDAATHPDVAVFDMRNAIVCYKAPGGLLKCKAIKFVSKDVHMDHSLFVGGELAVTTINANQFSVETLSARGAPVDWAARRAVMCYSLFVHNVVRRTECRTISMTFPMLTGAPTIENGNAPGILTANAPTVVDPNPTLASNTDCGGVVPNNYPTLRLMQGKALSSFDYFNSILCYTTPIPFCSVNPNPTGNTNYCCPQTEWDYAWGTGHCMVLQADVATATSLSFSLPEPITTGKVSEVAVSTFQSKSGDPIRALVCYITAFGLTAYTNTNGELHCNVVQRTATSSTGLTFLNSERTSEGAASPGVSKDLVVSGLSMDSYIKDTTIATLDPYNAVVCWTTGNEVHFCNYPTETCSTGGDGLILLPASSFNSTAMCRTLWVTGAGSSTYNSDVHSGAASAAAPMNEGSVSAIGLGPSVRLSASMPPSHVYPSATHLKPMYSVACFGNAATAECHLLENTPAVGTWAFNAAVDCVNGYGCETARRTLTDRFRTSKNATVEDKA